jgi:hypothetical protein
MGFLRSRSELLYGLLSLKWRRSDTNKIPVVWDMMPSRLVCITDAEELVAFVVRVGQEESRLFLGYPDDGGSKPLRNVAVFQIT